MRSRLGVRSAPSSEHLLARYHLTRTGIPGALPCQLEQERLALTELDDGLDSTRRHPHDAHPSVVVGNLPPTDDEPLQCAAHIVVSQRRQGRGLEPTSEGRALASTRGVIELRQTGEVHRDRERTFDAPHPWNFHLHLAGDRIPERNEHLRQRPLVRDVLNLVKVDHDDVASGDRGAADLNEQVGQR